MEKEQVLYAIIDHSPGIHFRDIARLVQSSHGTLGYHLHKLQKKGIIDAMHSGRSKHYFLIQVPITDRTLFVLARNLLIKDLLVQLSQSPMTHKQLTLALTLSPPTTTWYLQRLLRQDIIWQDERKRYSLKDKENIVRVLAQHSSSVTDRMAKNFLQMW